MIAKISKGDSFRKCINYILDDEKDAKLLGGAGLILISEDKNLIIDDFLAQAQLNPRVREPVGHISLSFSQQDKDKLTRQFLTNIALEYLDKMEIKDTQFLIVQHFDKEHPHIHIAFNRINSKGKTISDSRDWKRSEKICKELTLKYGLYFSTGKENVKLDRLKEPDKTKYEIYEVLKELVPQCKDWKELQTKLYKKGIEIKAKYKGQTKEIQGIIFYKNGYNFTGSKIDRQFSYSKINHQLRLNRNKEQGVQSNPIKPILSPSYKPSFGKDLLSIEDIFQTSSGPMSDEELQRLKQFNSKKKKKKGRQI